MSENAKAVATAEPRRTRGRPRAEDLAELEAELLAAARRCFVEKGYGATSMNEVAKAGRISRATLYSRFPTKADLLHAIIDEELLKTGTRIRHLGPKPKTLEAMLGAFAERVLQDSLSGESLELNRLIYSQADQFPELAESAGTRARLGAQHVAGLIREYAQREGVPCRDPDVPARMFTTLLRGFYDDAMLRGRDASLEEIKAWTRRMLKVFLAGRASW